MPPQCVFVKVQVSVRPFQIALLCFQQSGIVLHVMDHPYYFTVLRQRMLERWFPKWWWIQEHIVDCAQTRRQYQLATEYGLLEYCLHEDRIELIPTL